MKYTDILSSFGNSLKIIRKVRNISQEELASLCNLDRTYISGLECGKRNPTLKVLSEIANNLDVSLIDLFHGIEDIEGKKNEQDQKG